MDNRDGRFITEVAKRKKLEASNMVLILIFVSFFAINYFVPFMGEDYALTAFPKKYSSSLIEYIIGVLNRIYVQMATWNIRIGDQFSILFGNLNKIYFDLFNCFFSILYIRLIKMYSTLTEKNKNRKTAILYIFIFFSILIFQPVLGEIFFWKTGSTNYLWSMCLLLAFGLPIYRYLFGSQSVIFKNKPIMVLHSLLGLLAGLTNENTVICFLIVYFIAIVITIKRGRRIPSWIYLSFSMLVIGFLCLLFAPSSSLRMEAYNKIYGVKQMGVSLYLKRAWEVFDSFFRGANIYFLLFTVVLIFIRVLLLNVYRAPMHLFFGSYIIMLFLSVSSAGVLIAVPYVETRAFFLINTFMYIACCDCVNTIIKYIPKRILNYFIAALIVIMFPFSFKVFVRAISEYRTYSDFTEKREEDIENAINDHQTYTWHSYYKEPSRILNTREDYLLCNLNVVTQYYGADLIFSLNRETSANVIIKTTDFVFGKKQLGLFGIPTYIKESTAKDNKSNIMGWKIINDYSWDEIQQSTYATYIGGYYK